MAEKRVGAIILAAGRSDHMEELRPMLRLGQTTMIQKEIDTLRRAGITPIVVVTGYQAEELERHLSHRGVICVRNKRYETSQMFGSLCMGLRQIQKKVDRVLLFPADLPLASVSTVERMAEAPGAMAVPVFQGRAGHPVMLDRQAFSYLLGYRGEQGLRGAMKEWDGEIAQVELDDPGILLDTNTQADYESLLDYEKNSRGQVALACRAQVVLGRESDCFQEETAAFLEAVEEAGSMLGACQLRGISYSKGWKMVKLAEEQLGIPFLARQPGGSKGGFSSLTPEGKKFLARYRRLEKLVRQAADTAFAQVFGEPAAGEAAASGAEPE